MSSSHDLSDICMNFNKYIKKFISILNVSISNTSESDFFNKSKQKIFLVIDHEPLIILQECGPYIYKYREDIINKNLEKLFHECDIDDVGNFINGEIKSEDDKDSDSIKKLIHCLKTVWIKYSESEKKKVYKILTYLISEYSKYLLTKSH